MSKVLIAMSGGVDSSVAALLLAQKGYKPIGCTLKLFCYADQSDNEKACCSPSAINDARLVCERINIPHYVFSVEKDFKQEIIEDFLDQYRKGLTPNPCIRCNQLIKFDFLFKKAKELGANYLATGHYTRISESQDHFLLKGKDEKKDQSYFLYRLNRDDLSRVFFPLGELTKEDVRKIAKKAKLPVTNRQESQEVCFTEGDIENFIKKNLSERPGDILDQKGKLVGKHQGIFLYTIGQRKGIGGGFDQPMFVTMINADTNTITIGPEEKLYNKFVQFNNVHWLSDLPLAQSNLTAKVRYNMIPEKVTKIENKENVFTAEFERPVRAPAPGQSIVFYQGDVCLGGGTII